MSQHHDTDQQLYEPYWYMSYPRWGIFGLVHPYAEILAFGAGLILGLYMGGWTMFWTLTRGPDYLAGMLISLLGISGIGAFGVFQGVKRAAWMHRYTRITGTKPAFGDPANKPPGYDERGWFARNFRP